MASTICARFLDRLAMMMKWKFLYCRITVRRSRMIASRQVHFSNMSAFFARLFFHSATASRGANKRSLAFDALFLTVRAHTYLFFFHIPSLALSLTLLGLKRGPITMMIELEACRKRTLLGRERDVELKANDERDHDFPCRARSHYPWNNAPNCMLYTRASTTSSREGLKIKNI